MRTPKQGRAAAAGERGDRRREQYLPGCRFLGRGKTSCGLSQTVERYPDVSFYVNCVRTVWETSGMPWALYAGHGFFLRKLGWVPQKIIGGKNK